MFMVLYIRRAIVDFCDGFLRGWRRSRGGSLDALGYAKLWLIVRLAGRDHVAINLVLNKGGNIFTLPPGVRLLANNTRAEPCSPEGAAIHFPEQA